MARKPKIQPSPDDAAAAPAPEAATPDELAALARWGRKAKAAALSFASPPAADVGTPATDDAGTDASKADPTKAPGHKPKQAVGGEAAPLLQNGATEPQGQAPGQPAAEVSLDLVEADAPAAAAVPQAEAAADSGAVQPNRDPVSSASGAAQFVPEAGAFTPAKPAARWDRTTDRVQFDWPTIERVATQDGPNQNMAKLLVAARAEGARSRWPF